MANLHIMASSTNALSLEHRAHDVPWRTEVAVGVMPEEEGYIRVPDRPGLGIDLDEAAIASHPVCAVDEMEYRFRTPEEIQRHRAD